LQIKVVSLALNLQPGGPGPCTYVPTARVPQTYPWHWFPFPSPSTTRRAMVLVF
jgi:hypothetical protein